LEVQGPLDDEGLDFFRTYRSRLVMIFQHACNSKVHKFGNLVKASIILHILQGAAHKDIPTYDTWHGEHTAGLFDLSLVEESGDMPSEHYCGEMRLLHTVVYIYASDADIGVPLMRPRFYGGGLLKTTWVWVGPQVEDVTHDFMKFFARRVNCECDMFAKLDSAEQIQITREKFADRSGEICMHDSTPTELLLTDSARLNLDMLKKLNKGENSKIGTLGGCSGDVSQNPNMRLRAGPFLPSLQKSSIMLCTAPPSKEDHIYTCGELSFMHGWPSLECSPQKYKDVLNFNLSAAPLSVQSKLLGDGMSLNIAQAWLLYVMSHSVRRDLVEAMSPPLRNPDAESNPFSGGYYREHDEDEAVEPRVRFHAELPLIEINSQDAPGDFDYER